MNIQIRYHSGAIKNIETDNSIDIQEYLKDPKVMKISFPFLDEGASRIILYTDGTYFLNAGLASYPYRED